MRGNAHVDGLANFERDLRVLPFEWIAAEQEFERKGAQTIYETAKSNASKYAGINGIYRLAVQDLTLSGDHVDYGGKPYSKGAEFGAYQYHQFLSWRGKGNDAGYFFYPAIRSFRNGPMIVEYQAMVMSLVGRKFSH